MIIMLIIIISIIIISIVMISIIITSSSSSSSSNNTNTIVFACAPAISDVRASPRPAQTPFAAGPLSSKILDSSSVLYHQSLL